jgi:hypothetical protein
VEALYQTPEELTLQGQTSRELVLLDLHRVPVFVWM